MIRRQLWLLPFLVIVIALAFVGCSTTQTDNEKVAAAFKEIDLSNILDGTGITKSSLSSQATVGSKDLSGTWSGTAYSNLRFSSNVTNVLIVGDTGTATATGSFTFSGTLTCSGITGGTPWHYSFNFSGSGQGKASFVKVNDEWKVRAIEDMLLKCDNSNGQAPDIAPIQFTPANADVAAGAPINLSTTVTNKLSNPGATNLGFLVVTRGFIFDVNHNLQWSTASPYLYNSIINTNALNYRGNHYGAVVAYQLVGNPDLANHPLAAYGVYFSIRITMFKIS